MTLEQRLYDVQQTIKNIEYETHREPNSVKLLAVSKGHDAVAIQRVFQAGQRDFGENYWQEAQPKIQCLQELPICWHFIGAIQRNKT